MSNRTKLRRPRLPRTAPTGDARWNGEPATAIRLRVEVADAPEFPQYWARQLVGTERAAVRVTYAGSTFYLDDEDGSGWFKVTNGGGPGLPHRDLSIAREVLEVRR